MIKLHKEHKPTDIYFEPNEGERTSLCSNKGGMRSPSLDLSEKISPEYEMLLQQLAEILVEAIFWHYENEFNN